MTGKNTEMRGEGSRGGGGSGKKLGKAGCNIIYTEETDRLNTEKRGKTMKDREYEV